MSLISIDSSLPVVGQPWNNFSLKTNSLRETITHVKTMWMWTESFKTIVLCFRNVLDHRACCVWCYDEGHKAKCVHHWFRIYLLCYRKCSHLRRRCAVYSMPATVTTFLHIIRASMRCLKMTGSTVFDGYFFHFKVIFRLLFNNSLFTTLRKMFIYLETLSV